MSIYDSNYLTIACPYCRKNISENRRQGSWVDDLDDEGCDFFQCQKCKKFFKAKLDIYQEYVYCINKPSKEEVKKYNLIINKDKDIAEDCTGQTFIWNDLFSHKS